MKTCSQIAAMVARAFGATPLADADLKIMESVLEDAARKNVTFDYS